FATRGRFLDYGPSLTTRLVSGHDLYGFCRGGNDQELEERGNNRYYDGYRSRPGNTGDDCRGGFWFWWDVHHLGRYPRLLGTALGFVDGASILASPSVSLFRSAIWPSFSFKVSVRMRALCPLPCRGGAYLLSGKLVARFLGTGVCIRFVASAARHLGFAVDNNRGPLVYCVGFRCRWSGLSLL